LTNKQVSKIEFLKIQGVCFVFNLLVFNNLLYSVDLRDLLISKFLPVMRMHWWITYCIYSCK